MNAQIKGWAADTGVRAVKTAAQTLVALFGASTFNVLNGIPWGADFGIAAGAGIICILQNVQSFPSGKPQDPAEQAPAPAEPPAA
jgi:hypothetical protein